ncbi:MAG: transketolase C-terminal domain-containing protein [Patescibacteria group bacterium]
MLHPDSRLNTHIFDDDVEQVPVRNGYGEGLLLAGEENENVVVLCADLTESTRSEGFAKKFPKRFVEMGVAEQNLATVAAGMAMSGKVPFISSYASFSPGRNWEQIRTTAAYNNANVKIAGAHAGISVGPDGATHQAVEDVAIMRVIAGMKVFVPCDVHEARKATATAAKILGPVYMRFAREKTPVITTRETPFVPGKAILLWQGKKPECLIVGAGPLLYQALKAAHALEEEGLSVVVLNMHTIKPLDEEKLVQFAKKCGAVVTVEEHQVLGGLGGAVAELLGKKCPVPIEYIGMQDTFGESGQPAELIIKYGMDTKDIMRAVKRAVKRKE